VRHHLSSDALGRSRSTLNAERAYCGLRISLRAIPARMHMRRNAWCSSATAISKPASIALSMDYMDLIERKANEGLAIGCAHRRWSGFARSRCASPPFGDHQLSQGGQP
jgi:hypothetical protein